MMKIFNNLNSVQSIRIKDRYGSYYTVFIEAKKSTEIEGYQLTKDILDKLKSGSLLDLSNTIPAEVLKGNDSVAIDTVKVDTVGESETVDDSENTDNTVTLDGETEQEVVGTHDSVNESEVADESTDTVETLDDNNNEKENESAVFVCDICGGEFASKRGLEMHKSKSHK